MRVLLTGAAGQLGQALQASAPAQSAGEALQLIVCTRSELDLTDPQACRQTVLQHRPDWVLNVAAYTAVDRAEAEAELAHAVNAGAPAAMAQALAEAGGRLLQLSTDFVFDGRAGSPYRPSDPVAPVSVYGASKAAGEDAVMAHLPPAQWCILRTSWVYGPVGSNFLLTMLRLHRQRDQIAVVADQVGCPTATAGLAQACWRVIERGVNGIQHWSDAGAASWYDFALAIGELGLAGGLLERAAAVQPITTAEYPTPASRPSYSLLDCTSTRSTLGLLPLHWRTALAQVIGAGVSLPAP